MLPRIQEDVNSSVKLFVSLAPFHIFHALVNKNAQELKKTMFRMRLALIVLLLCVCTSAGVFNGLGDKVKNIFGGEASVGERIKAGLKKASFFLCFSKVLLEASTEILAFEMRSVICEGMSKFHTCE